MCRSSGFCSNPTPAYSARWFHRCANRRRPCSDEGEEFRDALLWLGLLNHMETRGTSSPVALIATDNHFTVGNGNHKLHPELKEDLDSRGLDLRYYFHLGQFPRGKWNHDRRFGGAHRGRVAKRLGD